MRPTEHVLDMFAVPGDLSPVPGGRGRSVRAGDLVLSPGRDATTQDAISPQLARLAVDLDTRRHRDRRDLRIAVPVPARDGSWVVDGWGATRHEPGTHPLSDPAAVRAVAAVLHAELGRAVTSWPLAETAPSDRRTLAERVAFGEASLPPVTLPARGEALLRRLVGVRESAPLGPDQLVDRELCGHVHLDPRGAPVVIDVTPSWRPVLWADAVIALDGVVQQGADPAAMEAWSGGVPRQAMLRAGIFHLLGDRPADVAALEGALARVIEGARP